MVFLIYDHSLEGFFTAIFEIYEYKFKEVEIRKEGLALPGFFTAVRKVINDEKKAERVYEKLKKLMGEQGIHQIIYSLLSEEEEGEKHIYEVIKYALAAPECNVLKDMSNPSVLKMSQYTKQVGREKHRMEAFVRFRLTCDGIYFAEIEPDFNVLPIIAKHFKDRYQDQKWVIFDRKRHYGIYYDLETVEPVEMKFNDQTNRQGGSAMLAKDEDLYQCLWRTYFFGTNIRSRKNMRLHIQHVPKRYWKYLTEKMPR